MVVEMKRDEGELMLEVHRAVSDMLMHCVATPKHGYQEPHTDKIVQALADLIYYSEEYRHPGPAEAGYQGAFAADSYAHAGSTDFFLTLPQVGCRGAHLLLTGPGRNF